LARTARSEQRADQEPARQVGTNAAPRSHRRLVWLADGFDAPATLETGAPAYLVAFHRGYMCGMGGQTEQALGLFREAVTLKPDFAEAHCNLGITLVETEQIPEATAAFRKAVALKPDFAEAHCGLGIAFAARGQIPKAIAAWRKAVALKPDYAEAYCNLGVAFERIGQLPKAIAAYREAVALKPDFANAHYKLGVALEKTGQLPEAIAAYRPGAIPKHARSRRISRDARQSPRGRGRSSQQSYREAVALKPDDDALAHYNLGVVSAKARQFPEAIAAFRKSVALKPDDAQAHYNLGLVLERTGQRPEAIAAYREAVALKPDDVQAHYRLGCVLQNTRQLSEAIAAYRKVIELKPNFAEAYCNLGDALTNTRQFLEAIDACRKAVELKPDDSEPHYSLGNALLAAGGDREAALSEYRKAFVIVEARAAADPGNAEWPRDLADIRNKINQLIEFDESNSSVYTDKAPPSEADDTSELRMEDDLNTAVKHARENVNAELAKVKAGLAKARLLATYEVLVRKSDLNNSAMPERERLRRAERLLTTYKRLRKIKPDFHDDSDQLKAARSITNKANYQRHLAKVGQKAKLTM
jgi:tetratricopeptide (TPR) repeat protein